MVVAGTFVGATALGAAVGSTVAGNELETPDLGNGAEFGTAFVLLTCSFGAEIVCWSVPDVVLDTVLAGKGIS